MDCYGVWHGKAVVSEIEGRRDATSGACLATAPSFFSHVLFPLPSVLYSVGKCDRSFLDAGQIRPEDPKEPRQVSEVLLFCHFCETTDNR